MTATRTPGITLNSAGHRIIDKEHRGVRIFARLGAVSDQEAEDRLHQEIARVEAELYEKANRRPRFSDCAAQYLFDSRGKRRVSDSARHVRQLLSYVGTLEPRLVHDGTLRAFVADRLSVGVSPTTINHGLKVVRTILNRAARVYRDDEGKPWLDCVPPQITLLPESRRPPYPITWEEQDRLFPRLPAHLARMALFAVNTGLRAGNVCSLRWSWEVFVPEVGRSVFVIPAEAYKTKRAHVAVLNDVAWSIVQAQRDKDKVWVFPYRGKPVGKMNNTAWKNARKVAAAAWKGEFGLDAPRDFSRVRVHDLRHTFGARLRAAGVSREDREVLLGHASRSMAGHYASADIGRLISQANLVLRRPGTCTVLRVANA